MPTLKTTLKTRRLEPHKASMQLFTAVKKDNPAQVANLLFHGANPNSVWGGPWIADPMIADRNPGDPLLVYASRRGNEKIVERLLKHGAKVNKADSSGATALMHASRQGHDKVVALLLQSGANVRAVSRKGETALMLARESHDEFERLLASTEKLRKAAPANKSPYLKNERLNNDIRLLKAAKSRYKKVLALLESSAGISSLISYVKQFFRKK